MYIPKGYDSLPKENSAVPSLYDYKENKYYTVSSVWPSLFLGLVLIRDMAIILKPESSNNNGMHQDYDQ